LAQPNHQYTLEEYLRDEQTATTRNDYLAGRVYNMSGGTPEHSRIAINLTSFLDAELGDGNCQVFNSDLKVGVKFNSFSQSRKLKATEDFITYPDASVVCGPLEFYKDDRLTLANPTVIFEVLSPSTRNYDRSVKLDYYRNIPTLMSYVMLDSERIWVEQYRRMGLNSWQVEAALQDLTDYLQLEDLGIAIPLSRLYNRVTFNESNFLNP
jgi:Uma2 family endonuclease